VLGVAAYSSEHFGTGFARYMRSIPVVVQQRAMSPHSG